MSTTKDQAAQTATYPPDLLQGSLEVGKEEPRHPGVKQFSLQALQQGGCQDLHPPSLAHSLAEVFQSTAGPWANPLIGNTMFCQEGDRNTVEGFIYTSKGFWQEGLLELFTYAWVEASPAISHSSISPLKAIHISKLPLTFQVAAFSMWWGVT